ncbi:MAG: sensor histidine kinase [Cytophagales bacterium]
MKEELITCKPGLTFSFLWFNITMSFLPKIILGLVIGIFFSIEDYLTGCPSHVYLYNFTGSIICSFMVWSGSSFIGTYIDDILDWEKNGVRKANILIASNVIYIAIVVFSTMFFLSLLKGSPVPTEIYIKSLILSILFATIINLIYIARSIFNFWKHTKYENELLKQENLRSQLESLKNQVNPHFLFNSLNTLISIIDDDPETAKNFTQNLSQVYRYILQAKEKDLVTLKEELDFANAYDYLLKIRYGDNLNFIIEIPNQYLNHQTPTLVLQMLVENAIKHNIISESKPLTIHIYIDEKENLVVNNNFQPKKLNVESDKVGLKNIAERFKLLDDKEIEVIQTGVNFTVKLPLIH